jgi:membrane-bound ClpP family serine protease
MTDYTTVYATIGILAVVLGIILYRMCIIVRSGHVGLVFILGKYRTGIGPGFAVVSVIATVRKVKLGGGTNRVLGMLGVADSDISTEKSQGVVKIGGIRLVARRTAPIRSGTTVRVIDDALIGEVLVGEEHPHPGGPKIPDSPRR